MNNDENSPSNSAMVQQFRQSLVTKIAMLIIRLGRNALLARVLGPADRGLFSLISSLPELIMVAGNAGLSNAVSYHAAKKTRAFKILLGNANALTLLLSCILFVLSFWVVQQAWLNNDNTESLIQFQWFIACAIPFLLIKIVYQNLLNVRQKISQINLMSILESLQPLVLFLFLWLVMDMNALTAAVWSWFISLLCLSLCAVFFLKSGFPVALNTNMQKDLLDFGFRGYLDTLFQKLLLRIDFIFVSAFIGNEALGYYSMATAAAEIILTIPNALIVPLFSFLLRTAADDKNTVTPIVLRLLITVMLISAALFALLGKVLIYILFGEAFLPAYEPLLILLPGIVFLSYVSLIRLDLLGHDKPGAISVISGVSVVLNIALNLLLIPHFGITGVAAASSIAYLFGAIGLYFLHSRISGLTAKETLILRRSDLALVANYVKRKRTT